MERTPTYKDSVVYIDKEGNYFHGYVDGSFKASMEDCARWVDGELNDAQYVAFCKWLEYRLFLESWRRKRDRSVGQRKLKVSPGASSGCKATNGSPFCSFRKKYIARPP